MTMPSAAPDISPHLIQTEADLAEGCAALAARHVGFAMAHEIVGLPRLRRRPGGFPALMNAICAQQVSVASAAAIWARLQAARADDPVQVRGMTEDVLRALGLSRPKARYALALAHADLDYAVLAQMPEAEALATLTAVKGIGPWTAEIYLMFSVGRADVFAPGDLALQEAAKLIFDLPERPTEKALREMSAAWSPWRAVAARLMWDYYLHVKNRAGILE